VINIDPKSKNRSPEGYLNRIEILKVDPGTILESSSVDGETIASLDKRLNDPGVLRKKQARKDEEAASLAAQKAEASKLFGRKESSIPCCVSPKPTPYTPRFSIQRR
jgi:hypothetical protein